MGRRRRRHADRGAPAARPRRLRERRGTRPSRRCVFAQLGIEHDPTGDARRRQHQRPLRLDAPRRARRVVREGPSTSASRSTATPTACSRSTTRARSSTATRSSPARARPADRRAAPARSSSRRCRTSASTARCSALGIETVARRRRPLRARGHARRRRRARRRAVRPRDRARPADDGRRADHRVLLLDALGRHHEPLAEAGDDRARASRRCSSTSRRPHAARRLRRPYWDAVERESAPLAATGPGGSSCALRHRAPRPGDGRARGRKELHRICATMRSPQRSSGSSASPDAAALACLLRGVRCTRGVPHLRHHRLHRARASASRF